MGMHEKLIDTETEAVALTEFYPPGGRQVAIPAGLIDSPWLQQAWAGIDPAQLWDCHVHLAGIGDGGSGIVVGPQLSSLLHPLHYAQRLFYMNAGCAHESPGKVDQVLTTGAPVFVDFTAAW